jgi:hypothetical protein
MRIMTLILCSLHVAAGALPSPAGAQPQKQASEFAGTGEAGGSGRSEGATPATNDFGSYVGERSYLEEQEFIARLNNLINALRDFVLAYQPGRVIDVKKVKAVRKAMHGLEKSEWFRPQKED